MNINELEEAFREAAKAYEDGQISASEYKSLLEGFEIEKIVTANAEELQKKEELNKIVVAAITVVSAVA